MTDKDRLKVSFWDETQEDEQSKKSRHGLTLKSPNKQASQVAAHMTEGRLQRTTFSIFTSSLTLQAFQHFSIKTKKIWRKVKHPPQWEQKAQKVSQHYVQDSFFTPLNKEKTASNMCSLEFYCNLARKPLKESTEDCIKLFPVSPDVKSNKYSHFMDLNPF